MSEETNGPVGDIDPLLAENLDDVSTKEPLWPKSVYPLEIVKLVQVRNKANTGNMINIELKTTKEHRAVTGENVPIGRRVFGRVLLTASENFGEGEIKRGVKKFMECFGQTGSLAPLDRFVGCVGDVRCGDSKATDDYPDVRTEIKDWVPRKH